MVLQFAQSGFVFEVSFFFVRVSKGTLDLMVPLAPQDLR